MRSTLPPRRRGYITQLVETLAQPPGSGPSAATSEAEVEIELENQLGLEIDQALATLPVDATKPDVMDVAGR